MSRKIIIKTKELELPIYSSNMIFVYSNDYNSIENYLIDKQGIDEITLEDIKKTRL